MKYILTLTLILVGFGFIACSKKGGDAGSPPPPVTSAPATSACSCGVGNVFSTELGSCLMRGACPNGYGYNSQQQNCVVGQVVTAESCPAAAGSRRKFGYALQNINRSQFELLLRYARVCDPYLIGWNFGSARCENYSDAGFVIIETTGSGNTATITIGAGASSPDSYGNTLGYFYGGNAYVSLSLQTQVRMINDNHGTEFVGVDLAGKDMGFRARSENGLLTSSSLPVDITYQGVSIGSAPTQAY